MSSMLSMFYPEDIPLRGRLLRLTLLAVGFAQTLYLALGSAGMAGSPLFPLDALWWIAACVLCGWFSYTGRVPLATNIFVAALSAPLLALVVKIGVGHPLNYFFLLPIVVCGLLIGGKTLIGYTVGYCVWMLIATLCEMRGIWEPIHRTLEPAHAVGTLLVWWTIFAQTGWFVWLLDRIIQRSMRISHAQQAILAQSMSPMHRDIESGHSKALRIIVEQLDGLGAMIILHDKYTDTIRLGLMESISSEVPTVKEILENLPKQIPASESLLWQELAKTKKPLVISDSDNDQRILYRNRLPGAPPHLTLMVPLLHSGEAIGWLSIYRPVSRRFSEDEIELAAALAQLVSYNVLMWRLADTEQEAAVLEERNRMAREIHDTLAQGFAGVVLQLEAASDMLDEDTDRARKHVERAMRLGRENLSEARRSVFSLRQQALANGNLPGELARIAEQMQSSTGIEVSFALDGAPRAIPAEVENNLLRIAQEAINNALKHARASQIFVSLSYLDEVIRLRIQDNGRGFNPEHVNILGVRFGLTGMLERAERMGGTIKVHSLEGIGTEIEVNTSASPIRLVEQER